MKSISKRVIEYQQSRLPSPHLFKDIMLFIYQYARRLHMGEDEIGDFIVYFHQQIHRLIEMYQDVGSSFEAYLATHIKFQIRTFRNLQHSSIQQLHFMYDEYRYSPRTTMSFQDSYHEYAQKDESLSVLQDIFLVIQKSKSPMFQNTFRRRVWFFVVKHIKTLTVEQMERLSHIFSFDMNTLLEHRDRIFLHTQEKNDRMLRLERRINFLFYQFTICTQRLRKEGINTQADEQKLADYRRKLHHTQERLSCISRTLSNQDLSDLLHIPKGTIDSGLFLLKQTMKKYFTTMKENRNMTLLQDVFFPDTDNHDPDEKE